MCRQATDVIVLSSSDEQHVQLNAGVVKEITMMLAVVLTSRHSKGSLLTAALFPIFIFS